MESVAFPTMVLIYGLITQQTDFDNDKCCCYVFPGKPEGADGEEMETSSHMDTQVSNWGKQACTTFHQLNIPEIAH